MKQPVQLMWECVGWEYDDTGLVVDRCGWTGESLNAITRCPQCGGEVVVSGPDEYAAAYAIGGWFAVWCMLHPELVAGSVEER